MVINNGSPRLDANGAPEIRIAFFPVGSVEVIVQRWQRRSRSLHPMFGSRREVGRHITDQRIMSTYWTA
jgi:hypothetical protein